MYETAQTIWRALSRKAELRWAERSAAAALTGSLTGWLTNPLDLVKTKLMANPGSYSGIANCFALVSANGAGSLFEGATTRAMWLLLWYAGQSTSYVLGILADEDLGYAGTELTRSCSCISA